MDYPFDVVVAIDRVTGQRVTNGTMTLYAESDTGKTTPLPILDSSKLPIPDGLLRTTSEAYVPKFWVADHARVTGVSGSSEVTLVSTEGYKIAAEDAATAAQAVETKANNGEFNGKSAYQVWLDAGNTGTEAEYIASLKGGKGDKGDIGLPGPDAIENDTAVATYINTPGTEVNTALTATIADAVPARPLPSIATPCELQARFLDFGGGFMRGAVAGDSTVNDGNDPVRKFLIRLGQLTPAGVGMKERLWSTGSSTYATDVDVKAGTTTASVGGTVLTDNFNRTAAELVGSTTSGGQVWAGTAGGWSSDGSTASASSGAAVLGFDTGSKTHTHKATLKVVTSAQAAQSQARVVACSTRPDINAGGNYVWALLNLTTTGILQIALWKRIAGVQTEIAATVTVSGITGASATPQTLIVSLDVAIQQVKCTVTVGGVDQGLNATVTESDAGALGTHVNLVMPANTYGAFKVDSAEAATPYTPGVYTGMEVWNAAVGGTNLTYQQARIATMYPSGTHFDWLLVTNGHNGGGQSPEAFIAEVDGFITAFKAAHPETLILISSQNPQFAPATTIEAHARRQAALRDYAMEKGYEYLPVFEAFRNQPDGGASLVNPADGIHPTVGVNTSDITTWCGNLLWTAVWLKVIESRRQTGVVPAITALPL